MKSASQVSSCGLRVAPPRTRIVAGATLSTRSGGSTGLVIGRSLQFGPRRSGTEKPRSRAGQGSFQNSRPFSGCLTWPQAGRLKSPRIASRSVSAGACQAAHAVRSWHRCLPEAPFACSLAIAAKEPNMPSMFNARDAGNYEKLMGRWSRRLAPLFIEHAGIADGEKVLEIGCGTGSLTFTLPQAAALARLTAIDHSEIYLAAAQAKNHDPHIRLEQGDGCALRFPDATFDRSLSMLVLPSVLPEPSLMVAEMRRVTRPGGVV